MCLFVSNTIRQSVVKTTIFCIHTHLHTHTQIFVEADSEVLTAIKMNREYKGDMFLLDLTIQSKMIGGISADGI